MALSIPLRTARINIAAAIRTPATRTTNTARAATKPRQILRTVCERIIVLRDLRVLGAGDAVAGLLIEKWHPAAAAGLPVGWLDGEGMGRLRGRRRGRLVGESRWFLGGAQQPQQRWITPLEANFQPRQTSPPAGRR